MQRITPKSKREQFGERLRKKYPEKEYADDEALFDQIDNDYTDYEKEIEGFRDREKELNDLMVQNPKAAQFIADLAAGRDPWIAVIERMGIDGITDLLNDPAKKDEFAEANKKYIEAVAKSKEMNEQFDQNFPESLNLVQQIQKERGVDDATVDAAGELIQRIFNEALIGKYSAETINMAIDAITRDADLENARTEGIVAGRNAKIDEQLRKPKQGDGMPNLGGSNNAPAKRGKAQSIFNVANEAY